MPARVIQQNGGTPFNTPAGRPESLGAPSSGGDGPGVVAFLGTSHSIRRDASARFTSGANVLAADGPRLAAALYPGDPSRESSTVG